jgi:hypothetical protein
MNPQAPETLLSALGWTALADGTWRTPDGKRRHTRRVALLLATDPATSGAPAPALFKPRRRGRPRKWREDDQEQGVG